MRHQNGWYDYGRGGSLSPGRRCVVEGFCDSRDLEPGGGAGEASGLRHHRRCLVLADTHHPTGWNAASRRTGGATTCRSALQPLECRLALMAEGGNAQWDLSRARKTSISTIRLRFGNSPARRCWGSSTKRSRRSLRGCCRRRCTHKITPGYFSALFLVQFFTVVHNNIPLMSFARKIGELFIDH